MSISFPAEVRGGADCPVVLRDYQADAVASVTALAAASGRARLLMFCATGKTLVALCSAVRIAPPDGVVVVLVPTLDLLSQTLAVWASAGVDHEATAVCGDPDIGESWTHPDDLPCPVSRDPEVAARWLARPSRGLKLVLATHFSADRVACALLRSGVSADVTVVDEAHWTAGRADKAIAVVHDEARFPSRFRLYATATPKVVVARPGGELESVSMADPAVYGPVAYDYPASRAIAEGWVDDYRVAVIGVPRSEATSLLRNGRHGGRATGHEGAGLHRAVVQAALAKAATTWGLRRVLVFTGRVADAASFAQTLPQAVAALPPENRPPGRLTASHVSGVMPGRQRRAALADLRDPPDAGWTVLANARCLAEGVDVPAIDGVVLTARTKSSAGVLQAVGRALRPHPDGRGTSLVLVPLLLPDDGAIPDLVETSGWSTMLQTLRKADDTLASDL
ncbi:DEAD/DEAH box helicase family protein, partial [Amycolatopsis sp. NPDC000746]|uniref:DEAD/DEAH box helicase family protein n=1 Tax=Amycolatopsis sp. NPDC000746 TaxID=3154270 RepID=UPI003326DFE6